MCSFNISSTVPFLFISFALHFHGALLCFDTIKQNGRFSLDLYTREARCPVHLSKKYAALCWKWESNTNQNLQVVYVILLMWTCLCACTHTRTHTHTQTDRQSCSFIHWHLHSDIHLCFLPVSVNILLQRNVTVTQYSILSLELWFWGCNVNHTIVGTTSKMCVPASLLLLIGRK
jgi:hypothetical protein